MVLIPKYHRFALCLGINLLYYAPPIHFVLLLRTVVHHTGAKTCHVSESDINVREFAVGHHISLNFRDEFLISLDPVNKVSENNDPTLLQLCDKKSCTAIYRGVVE